MILTEFRRWLRAPRPAVWYTLGALALAVFFGAPLVRWWGDEARGAGPGKYSEMATRRVR